MKQRFRIGKISFQDPLILCGALAILLYFDASGFLRVGLLAAVLHEMGHIMAYLFLRHRFPHIEVTMTGFCMKTRKEHFSANEQLLLAAAGLFHRLAHGLAQGLLTYCQFHRWMARKFYAVSCRVAPANSYMEKPMEWV